MEHPSDELEFIHSQIEPFLLWLYREAKGQPLRSVNAYSFRATSGQMSAAGVEWLMEHLAVKKLIRYMSFGPLKPDSDGKLEPIQLTERGVTRASKLFEAQQKRTQRGGSKRVKPDGDHEQRTILVLAANPRDTDPVRLDEEIKRIEQGLERAKQRDSFKLIKKLAVTDEELRRALLDYEPEIVHFSGHGAGAEGLALEDEQGNTHLVSGEALADLFRLCSKDVKCVVLNACYSQAQAEAIAQDIDYVVGMKRLIGDPAAIKFAVGFYDALLAGRSFEDAFSFGVNAIRTAGISEHLTPVLKKKILPQEPHSRYWNEQAINAAEFLHLHHFEAHRGAVRWCPNVTAIFANDGDDPVNLAASSGIGAPMLRKRLIADGLTELAIGRAHGGTTWCILVRSENTSKLFDLAWQYLPKPNLNPAYVAGEKKIAMDRVWMLLSNPVNESC